MQSLETINNDLKPPQTIYNHLQPLSIHLEFCFVPLIACVHTGNGWLFSFWFSSKELQIDRYITRIIYSCCALTPNRVTFAISHRRKIAWVLERPQFWFNQVVLNSTQIIFGENIFVARVKRSRLFAISFNYF